MENKQNTYMYIVRYIVRNLLLDFSADKGQEFSDREWVWERYGTAYRALYTHLGLRP